MRSVVCDRGQWVRGWLLTILGAAAWLWLSAAAMSATAQPGAVEEDRERLLKRLDIAEREAELYKRKLRELRAELEDLGPYLEEARYRKLVDEVAEQTAEARGLPMKEPVRSVVLDREELADLLDQLLDQELTEEMLRGQQLTWEILGLLPEGLDLRVMYSGLLEEQVGGVYDDRSKQLYVVDTFNPKSFLGRVILSHEICHALQDQNYVIEELPFRTDNEDQNLAMASVLEGDATLLMVEWGAENFTAKDMLGLTEVFNQGTEQLETVPPAIVQSLLFPYLAGLEFLMQVQFSGRSQWRERVFQEPPRSTEQVLHPEKYLIGEEPVAVLLPEWDGSGGLAEVYRGPQGEWVTRLALLPPDEFPMITMLSLDLLASEPMATDGAAGWGGDLAVTLANEDDSRWAMYWRSVWDSEEDAVEFEQALRRRVPLYDRFEGAVPTPVGTGGVRYVAKEGSQALVERQGDRVDVLFASDRESFDAAINRFGK